ncbi:MAG TPA: amino acid permease, partial [Bacteroidia bacterium]|nr:amino acid permease [Bacteroidia bacterium]
PSVGFLSGWVSVTVGFAAPVAAASTALGLYVNKIYGSVNPQILAVSVILLLTIVHSINLKLGSAVQRAFTLIKVVIIVMFVGFGLFHHPEHSVSFSPTSESFSQMMSSAFAVSLVFVTYAYSGWNAAAYIAGDLREPQKNLPKALIWGTLIVMVIYTALNFIFLYSVPINELKGVVEVGYLSANKIFGSDLGRFMSLVIALLLVSTVSAMILAGPRVMHAMGNDIRQLKIFSTSNKNNVPYVAVIFQSVISIVLVLTSSFESLITYVGFTLNLFTFLTVFGIFILRAKHKEIQTAYKTPLYPIPPILFLLISGWILFFIFKNKTMESLFGLGTVAFGFLVYWISEKYKQNDN